MHRPSRTLLYHVLCLSTLFGTACGKDAPPGEAAASDEAPAAREPATATIAAASDFVLARHPATAIARADASAVVTAPCEGRVATVAVNEGDRVEAGATLASVACLDAGVLSTRRESLDRRIRALGERRRDLEALRRDGLVEVQRIVDIDRELLALRGERVETQALIERSGLAADAPADAGILALMAPRAGVVTHVAATPGAPLERIGTPVLTIAAASTDRIEARLPLPPLATHTFRFVPLAGASVDVQLVSIRGPDGDVPEAGAGLRAVFAVPAEAALVPGTPGHIEIRDGAPNVGRVTVDTLQRRPAPRGEADAFCLFAPAEPDTCRAVRILAARGDMAVVTDAEGATPFVRAGVLVRAEVPSHIAATHEAAP